MPQQASGEKGRRVVPATPRQTQTTRARLAVILHIALRALMRHVLRSVLATLGISIGVGAFLCSMAVGQGAARQIEDQIRSLGENFIWIEAGNRNVNGVRTGTHGTQSLTVQDMQAIQRQIPLLAQISPNVDLRVQVVYRDQNWATQVRGVTPAYRAVRGWGMARGTFFTEDDVASRRKVCVLGRRWSPTCLVPLIPSARASVCSRCRARWWACWRSKGNHPWARIRMTSS